MFHVQLKSIVKHGHVFVCDCSTIQTAAMMSRMVYNTPGCNHTWYCKDTEPGASAQVLTTNRVPWSCSLALLAIMVAVGCYMYHAQ